MAAYSNYGAGEGGNSGSNGADEWRSVEEVVDLVLLLPYCPKHPDVWHSMGFVCLFLAYFRAPLSFNLFYRSV